MVESPLSGLTVAVTRPRDQAVALAQAIERLGGNPFLFPLLEIEAAELTPALRGALSHLAQADLAIFISPNAVRYGIEALRASGITFPAKLSVAAVGQGSARALQEQGIIDVIVPAERFDSEGLLALPELRQIAGRRVAIVRGNGGRELLGETLAARGAEVEYVECYRRSKPQQGVQALLAAEPAVISVTSSEALGYLWDMLDLNGRATLRDTPLFVPHPRIAELAARQGWRQVEVTAAGDAGLLAALVAWGEKEKAT